MGRRADPEWLGRAAPFALIHFAAGLGALGTLFLFNGETSLRLTQFLGLPLAYALERLLGSLRGPRVFLLLVLGRTLNSLLVGAAAASAWQGLVKALERRRQRRGRLRAAQAGITLREVLKRHLERR